MSNIAYIQTFINMYKIVSDETASEYNRQFAALFRRLFQINLNINNNQTVQHFKYVSDTLLMTYFHRIIQLTTNTIDPKESEPDFNELKEIVCSIHQAILTNKNPEWIANQIAQEIGCF